MAEDSLEVNNQSRLSTDDLDKRIARLNVTITSTEKDTRFYTQLFDLLSKRKQIPMQQVSLQKLDLFEQRFDQLDTQPNQMGNNSSFVGNQDVSFLKIQQSPNVTMTPTMQIPQQQMSSQQPVQVASVDSSISNISQPQSFGAGPQKQLQFNIPAQQQQQMQQQQQHQQQNMQQITAPSHQQINQQPQMPMLNFQVILYFNMHELMLINFLFRLFGRALDLNPGGSGFPSFAPTKFVSHLYLAIFSWI